MMTLISRLCALCAMSALMQLVLPEKQAKGGLRVICGMLMLELTLSGVRDIAGALSGETDLMALLEGLMR
ncbi:MAG: hypothetical protein Q4G52_12900 [Clostridia bacterium]|nr:hypothetical protein [Clostridia bacterium]